MATVETHTEAVPPTEMVYDGFISYSHSADDLLAPRLQAALQRFAKPWWKRRAIRVFRDEASLAANPHLWTSITEALDQSGWFVLLCSREAAESEWVNREVEYWLEHQDHNRIIPVVTDGEFVWGNGDIGATTTAAPPALYGAFADEPRWVDTRFARSDEQLDLNNASFRAAVADIASAIRGIPKDELESEEVRQHRRTIRTAWAAGVVLLILAVAAAGAALVAVDRGNEATAQRVAAEENAAEADAQRARAEQQTEKAEQLAFDARTEALAASAIAQLDTDPELSLLLAIEASQRETTSVTLSALHQAVQRHRAIFEVSIPPPETPLPRAVVGGMSPSGDLLVLAGLDQGIEVWEVGGEAPFWTERPPPGKHVYGARFSTDGQAVFVLLGSDELVNTLSPDRGPEGTFFVRDAQTGAFIDESVFFTCPNSLDPSSLPAFVDLAKPMPWVTARDGCWQFRVDVGFIDPLTGRMTYVTQVTAGTSNDFALYGVPTSDAERRYLAVGAGGPGQVIEVETGEVIFAYDRGMSTLSADGTRLLARGHDTGRPLELWNLETDERLWSIPRVITRAWFSSDETLVYGTSSDGSTYVIDAATGDQILRLAGQDGTPIGAMMAEDSSRLTTFADDFSARVWDLGSMRSEGSRYRTHPGPRQHSPASADVGGGVVAVWGGVPRSEDALWEIAVIKLANGEEVARVVGGVPAISPDGSRLAYRSVEVVAVTEEDLLASGQPGTHPRVGPIRIVDIATGGLITEIEVLCQQFLLADEVVPSAGCDIQSAGVEWDLEFSPDGTMLGMADSYTDQVFVWDANTGEVVWRDQLAGSNARAVAFTPDGQRLAVLFAGGVEQRVRLYGLERFSVQASVGLRRGVTYAEMVFTPDGSLLIAADNNGDVAVIDTESWNLLEPIPAHLGSALDVAVSPAGTLIASSGEDAFLRIWDLADRSLVTEIKFEADEIANVEFIDDTHLLITAGFGAEAVVITLDPAELLGVAKSRLTRSFSAEECDTYGLDPCPKLEEIRGG